MKICFLFFYLFLSFLSFPQDSDSTSSDTSYRLLDLSDSSYRLDDIDSEFVMADTNLRFIVIETEPSTRIRRPLQGVNHAIGSNYGSTQNVNPTTATIICVSFLLIILYIVFRVRRSLKADKTKHGEE